MKSKFQNPASKIVTLTNESGEEIQITLSAPPLGWGDRLDAVFEAPVGGYETTVGQGRKELPATDAQTKEHGTQKGYLMIGKVLALGGELEAVYPDPLPTERGQLVKLSEQVQRELAEAGLNDGHIVRLTEAYYELTLGDVYREARAAGNASRRNAAK